jgi:hypothetical protein
LQWICCSFFYWNQKGTVLNIKKIYLDTVKSLSITPRDTLSIQGRETGPGTNHGSPLTNREFGSALSYWCLGLDVYFFSSWQIVLSSIHEVENSFFFITINELLAVIADKFTVKLKYFLCTVTNGYVCVLIC